MDKPIRILIVEDRAIDAELLVREVQRAGFQPEWQRVELEADFLAALDNPPDLVLSDYSLPHFDGITAVVLLRQRGLDTPFILVSGIVGEDVAVEAMKRGATDYLLKDRIGRLGSAIERALEQKRLQDERRLADLEIRNQLQELRRWHEVMLDREDRILQLKREVNEQLAAQSLPPRYASPEAT
ncbi:MAG TPA: response regulator [Candidatus Limnocylindria bacterium]|jgi:DNA-binding NtrC family response regulator|nr:response regulator [Candidatus Limnocylindria bacterium]